jgi:hypothetical protein
MHVRVSARTVVLSAFVLLLLALTLALGGSATAQPGTARAPFDNAIEQHAVGSFA